MVRNQNLFIRIWILGQEGYDINMKILNSRNYIRSIAVVISILMSAVCLFGCGSSDATTEDSTPTPPTTTNANNSGSSGTSKEEIQQIIETVEKIEPQGEQNNDDYVSKLISEMTMDEKIYQMMFVTPEAITGVGQVIQAGKGTADAIKKYPVGGIIYFTQNIKSPEQIAETISNTQAFSKIPLFIGVDEEGGLVSRLGSALGSKQPSMKEIGETKDPSRAYDVGTELATTLSELGFNVDFAPVADVLINPNNSVIGSRAFGSDPDLVAEMVAQEVKGLQEKNISATLKHFPGHGSTSTDSHTGYSESDRTMEDLKSCEFVPFKAGIEADVDFIMVAHITLPNATKEALPATLSKELITDCLKGELGYKGLVITDSFQMGAITQKYTDAEAVVKAIDAGVDIILMPENLIEAHTAIKKAVENGKLTEERITESVRKILSTKLKRGILGK